MNGDRIPLIGDLLRKRRQAKKFSLITVADYIQLSVKHLGDIERNYRPPPKYDVLLRVGIYLGITEKELMWSAAKYYNVIKKDKRNKTDE